MIETSTGNGRNGAITAKPFGISKRAVWEAYKRVKANRGAAGVDGQSIADFDENREANLYKLWNRLASGSYFPPPVRRVDIPKGDGRTRPLGIPTVADRIAQMVVAMMLGPILEPHFHADSYGYRPKKSAKQALAVARQRCWRYDWVLDLDIKSFFETIDHERLMSAVRRHTTCSWALLYIERWLRAPTQLADGTLVERTAGTPQGGVISPLLANLFLHYAFDAWMQRTFLGIPFERYADDVICHCRSEAQAIALKDAIEQRFAACLLTLHPQKTKIAYCKDDRRRGPYPVVHFDFLGFSFRPRKVTHARTAFTGFNPAISTKAATAIRQEMRSWKLHLRSDLSLEDIAAKVNPSLRGWINYYGIYHRSVLARVLARFDHVLSRWAMRKYGRFKHHRWNAMGWVHQVAWRQRNLFAHWETLGIAAG